MYVIEKLAIIYKNEEYTREKNMNPVERLKYHKKNSKPVMENLKKWMEEHPEHKDVEDNSPFGKALKYMLKRWNRFTRFYKKKNVPLDNNISERTLKKAILHRKNSLYYRTSRGAQVGDIFMSIIYTCELLNVNALHYMSSIIDNYRSVEEQSEDWMPWNYKENLQL
jgi:hypothetical protein